MRERHQSQASASANHSPAQAGHMFWHFAILLLGIALGLIISSGGPWLAEPAHSPTSSLASDSSTTASNPEQRPEELLSRINQTAKPDSDNEVRIVLVTHSSFRKQRTESGLLLPGKNRLVVRLSSLLDVQALQFESDSIGANDLAVMAIDGLNDLALLESVMQDADLLSISAAQQERPSSISEQSILLGKEYVIETSTRRLRAKVNKKLTEFDDGTSGYPIRGSVSTTDRLMPVFSVEGNGLVGVAMPVEDELAGLKLIDKAVIESLISDSNKLPATSISQLQHDFFRSTPLGILTQFGAHNANGNLEGMLEFGEQYLASGWLPKREKMIGILTGTISRQLKAFQRTNDFDAAEKLFARASSFLARHSAIELTYFQMQLAQSNPKAALSAARHWLREKNDGNKTAWLALHYQAVFGALEAINQLAENANTLLTSAIEIEPTRAGYYVARAEEFAQAADYVAAISDFEQAIDLDPRLAIDLEREINKLHRRLDTPGTLRVPVTHAGGVLTTQVLINGVAFNFVVDTGASRTAISTSTMDYLRLTSEAFGSVPITTANGLTYGRNLTLNRLDVVGATAHDLNAVVVDHLGTHDGLLGLDFLGGYQLDMDSSAGEILLTPY
jgi:clan AA aspartic protease (TIGR02281 family)